MVRLGASVTKIGQGGVSLSDGSELSATTIVNAAGAWATELTPGIEIKKRKGHLVITDRYPGFLRHQLVELGISEKRALGQRATPLRSTCSRDGPDKF